MCRRSVGPVPTEYLLAHFNARLRDELLDGEIFYTLREAQIVIESCCIRGIHGPACGSAFVRQLRGRAVLSFAAT